MPIPSEKLNNVNSTRYPQSSNNRNIVRVSTDEVIKAEVDRKNFEKNEGSSLVVEFLGADSLLTLDITKKLSILSLVDGHFDGNSGDKAYIKWESDKTHFFDPKSEKNLSH